MNQAQAKIVLMYAEANMNLSEVARNTFYHRNTLEFYMGRIYDITGLDPKNFYDLVILVDRAKKVLMGEEE